MDLRVLRLGALLLLLAALSLTTNAVAPPTAYSKHPYTIVFNHTLEPPPGAIGATFSSLSNLNAYYPITICSWVYSETLASTGYTGDGRFAYYYGRYPYNGFGLVQVVNDSLPGQNNKWSVSWGDSVQASNVAISAQTWTHICISITSNLTSSAQMFINGQQVALASSTASYTSPDFPVDTFNLGGVWPSRQPSQSWHGRLARLSIWEGLRTEAEIAEEMKANFIGDVSKRLRYWTLKEGSRGSYSEVKAELPNSDVNYLDGRADMGARMPGWLPWTCNDGIVDPWEQCDDPSSSACSQCEQLYVATHGLCNPGFAVARLQNDPSDGSDDFLPGLLQYGTINAIDGVLYPDMFNQENLGYNGSDCLLFLNRRGFMGTNFIVDFGRPITIEKFRYQNGWSDRYQGPVGYNDVAAKEPWVFATNDTSLLWTTPVARFWHPNGFTDSMVEPILGWSDWYTQVGQVKTRYAYYYTHQGYNDYAGFYEFEVLTKDPPLFEVVSKYVTATSNVASLPKAGPERATDCQLSASTPWAPVSVPSYLTLDLGRIKTIHGFRTQNIFGVNNLCAPAGGNFTMGTNAFRFGVSIDGVAFTTVLSSNLKRVTQGTTTGDDFCVPFETFVFGETQARYVRFYVDSNYGTNGGLVEIEILKYIRTPVNVAQGACVDASMEEGNSPSTLGPQNINDNNLAEVKGKHYLSAPSATGASVQINLEKPYQLSHLALHNAVNIPSYNATLKTFSIDSRPTTLGAFSTLVASNSLPDMIVAASPYGRIAAYDPPGISNYQLAAPTVAAQVKLTYQAHLGDGAAVSELQLFSTDYDNVPVPLPASFIASFTPATAGSLFDGIWSQTAFTMAATDSVVITFAAPTIVTELRVQNSAGPTNNHGAFQFAVLARLKGADVQIGTGSFADPRGSTSGDPSEWSGPKRYCNAPIVVSFPPVMTTALTVKSNLAYGLGAALSEIQIWQDPKAHATSFDTPAVNLPQGSRTLVLPGKGFIIPGVTMSIADYSISVEGVSGVTLSAVDATSVTLQFATEYAPGTRFAVSLIRAAVDNAIAGVQITIVPTTVDTVPFKALIAAELPYPVNVTGQYLAGLTVAVSSNAGQYQNLSVSYDSNTRLSFSLPPSLTLGVINLRLSRNNYVAFSGQIGEVFNLKIRETPNVQLSPEVLEAGVDITISLVTPTTAIEADIAVTLDTSAEETLSCANLQKLNDTALRCLGVQANLTGIQLLFATVSTPGEGTSYPAIIATLAEVPSVYASDVVVTPNTPSNLTITGRGFPPSIADLQIYLRMAELFPSNGTTQHTALPLIGAAYTGANILCGTVLIDRSELSFVTLEASLAAFGSAPSLWTKVGHVYWKPIVTGGQSRFLALGATSFAVQGQFFPPNTTFDASILITWYNIVNSPLFNGNESSAIANIWPHVSDNFTSLGLPVNSIRNLACDSVTVDPKTGMLCQSTISLRGFVFGSLWIEGSLYQTLGLYVVIDPPVVTSTPDQALTTSSPSLSILGSDFDGTGASLSVTLTWSSSTKRETSTPPTCVPRLSPTAERASSVVCDLQWTDPPSSRGSGPLLASVSSYGVTLPAIAIGQVTPAPTIIATGDSYKVAANVREISVLGANFPSAAVLSQQTTFSFTNGVVSSLVAAKSSSSVLVFGVSGLGLGPVDLTFRFLDTPAFYDIPQGLSRTPVDPNYVFLATVVPPPTLDAITSKIGNNVVTNLTLTGSGFDASSLTATTVQLFPSGHTEPQACHIFAITPTEISCQSNGPISSAGPLSARIISYGGESNEEVVGFVDDSSSSIAPGQASNDGALAGGVVGGVLGAALIAGLIVFLVIWRRRREAQLPPALRGGGSVKMVELGKTAEGKQIESANWFIPYTDLTFVKKIGKGAFGQVYKGQWRDSDVAIKEALLETDEARTDFFTEAELMLSLRPHKNIVQTFGVSYHPETGVYYLVLELCMGSLDKIIFNPSNRAKLTEQDLINYAKKIAQGMYHVSKEGIVHRDLAVRNILLSQDGTPKIADFGMSRLVEAQNEGTTASSVGPIAWMAPESINRKYSAKSDVWMYGVCLWEIMTGLPPHGGIDRLVLAVAIRDAGKHPDIDESWPPVIKEILKKCWIYNPDERPDFHDVLGVFKKHTKKSQSVTASEEDAV